MTVTKNRPAFRKPWEHGAKAYYEADTLEALKEGAKRKRNPFMVHLSLEGFGHLPCGTCGIPLADEYGDGQRDTWGTGHYSPKAKRLGVQHYYCSWQTLMDQVFRLGRYINL